MTAIIFRCATLLDIAAASKVHKTLYPNDRYSYAENIRHPQCINFVAEEGKHIVGFASVLLTRWNPEGKYLWERVAPYFAFLGVLPEWRRRGIAGRLVDEAVRHTDMRCPAEPFIFLEHDANNEDAHRLYESRGFKKLTIDEVHAATGLRNYKRPVMRLKLRASSIDPV